MLIAREGAEGLLELCQRAVHVDAGMVRIVALPDRDRGAPVAVAGDRPVAGALEPAPELTVLHVAGDPVDLLVQLEHALALIGDLHVPGADGLVDQRVAAAPAVRVGVHVAGLAQQAAGALEIADDRTVRLEHLDPGDLVESRAGEVVQELGAFVHRDDHGDAVLGVDLLVDLTVGGGLMDDAGAVVGGDVVRDRDDPGVLRSPLLAVLGVDGPQRLVLDVLEQLAGDPAPVERGHGVLGALVAELLGVGADERRGHQEAALPGGGAVGRAERTGGDHRVLELGAHSEREVRRQGPRCRGPGEGLDTLEVQLTGLLAHEREGDRDGLVLALLIDVVVHAQLVRAQRCLVLPAVGQHVIALVGAALVVEGLERPQHGLHERDVEGLVVVLEVDPAGLAGDVVLPLLRVLQHRVARGVVEGLQAHLLDLGLLGHAELPHRLELGGQAVGVPAEAAIDLVAAHRAETRDDVLDETGQQVAVVGQTVGEGRAVVEDELLGALALGDRGAEGVVGPPELLDGVLERGQVRRGDERVSADRVDHGTDLRGRTGDDGWDITMSEDALRRRAGGAVPPRLTPGPHRRTDARGVPLFLSDDGLVPAGSTGPAPASGRRAVLPAALR